LQCQPAQSGDYGANIGGVKPHDARAQRISPSDPGLKSNDG